MNPMLILQGISATAGIVGSLIPDKEKTVMHSTNTEGSDLAGRVPGAVGPTTQKTFSKEYYAGDLKKGLLMASGIAGAGASIGNMLKPDMNISGIGSGDGSGLIRGIKDLTSNLFKTKNSLPAVNPTQLPDEAYVDDIPQNILDLAKTTVTPPGLIIPENPLLKGR